MTMKYLLETGPQTLSIEDAPSQQLEAGEVRVTVAYVGICHSDTARVAEGTGPFPSRMGHEVSGIVSESATDAIAVGDRVAAYVVDGYATEVVAPADKIVPLHDDCTLLDGALAEPLACVIGGIEMLDLTHESEIVVVGAGFMGLMAVRFLVAAGHRVTVIEPRELARELALGWGADRALHPDDVDSAQQASVVVEATGGAAGLQLASDLVRIGGTLGILGYHQSGGGKRTVDMESWNYRALRVLSLHHRNGENVMRWMDRAQRMAGQKILVPSELVGGLVSLEDLPRVLVEHPDAGTIKLALEVAGG
jgi:threonine dehydrogenase-like Zn-dependent dehydrogenase